MKKGQVWSVDAILGVFLFIIISIAVITFSFSRGEEEKAGQLKEEGDKIYNWLAKDQVINDKQMNPDRIKELAAMDYEDLKTELGVDNDFCLYLVDEEGKLMYIDIENNITGIGSPKVLINGTPCNQH